MINTNTSYTNKDFNSIYTELLEYAKKLSYKWDPTASDESDPGVILLKLAAIIGDKDNYNIDKNILELMPASVQQLPAARQLFEQCGYYMRYYRAAEGQVNITIKEKFEDDEYDPEASFSYKIPMFTMFTDADKSVVYSTVETKLVDAESEDSLNVIQGTATPYTINNDPLITIQNLDHNNRLYFTESNIAENGIFITNYTSDDPTTTNYAEWRRVDNLLTEGIGKRCYRFGLTLDNSVCYIEFPEDIDTLIGEGLHITYVRTDGAQGNISANKLNNFYTDTYFMRSGGSEDKQVQITTDSATIKNTLPITDGYDPETIDEAYKSYKRVKNTFDTLVSLKDYTDYMITNDIASNGYVCDRTNDIQHSYKISSYEDGVKYVHSVVEEDTSTQYYIKNADGQYEPIVSPTMNPTNLCVYALSYAGNVQDDTAFRLSFTLSIDAAAKAADSFNGNYDSEESLKSLQHDFIDYECDRILMLKNKYSITANIVPKYTLALNEKFQMISNIEKALYSALNATQLEFGEPVDPNLIQDTIFSADERIKSLIDFRSPTYETYAVYKHADVDEDNNLVESIRELRIDSKSPDGKYVKVNITSNQFKQERDKLFYEAKDKSIRQVRPEDTYDHSKVYFKVDETLHDLWNKFRIEVFAKNVLNGSTQLYTPDSLYKYGINQTDMMEHNNIEYVNTNTNIEFKQTEDLWVCDPLLDNENIVLTAPNFVDETSYSNYVKFIYVVGADVGPDDRYELNRAEDFIIFFYKQTDADVDYTYVKYDCSDKSLAKFIVPSGIALYKYTPNEEHPQGFSKETLDWIRNNVKVGKGKTDSVSKINALNNKSFTDFIKTEVVKDNKDKTHVLTGTRKITTQSINEIHINNNIDGCSHVYWFLNNKDQNDEYTLFNDSNDLSYTLQSGEYFIYTNDQMTSMHLLGEGTKIHRNTAWQNNYGMETWVVKAVGYDEFIENGLSLLADKWFNISKVTKTNSQDNSDAAKNRCCLWATEQQHVIIGPGNTLTLECIDSKIKDKITSLFINSDGVIINNDVSTPLTLEGFKIKYQTDSESDAVELESTNSSYVKWSANSLYSLNMSPETPQKVAPHQSISYSTDLEDVTIQGNNDGNPCYVLSDIYLNVTGGKHVYLPNILNKYEPVNLLTYNLKPNTTSVKSYNFNVLVTPTPEEGVYSYDAEFQVTEGSYLLQFNTSKEVNSFDVTSQTDEVTVTPMFGNNKNLTKFLYKLHVSSDSDNNIPVSKLNITYTSESEDVSLIVNPLYKYSLSSLEAYESEDSSFDFETELLKELDMLDPSLLYNYTYKIANAIDDPLDAATFLQSNHFFNKYTICEWDTNVDNITVHEVSR